MVVAVGWVGDDGDNLNDDGNVTLELAVEMTCSFFQPITRGEHCKNEPPFTEKQRRERARTHHHEHVQEGCVKCAKRERLVHVPACDPLPSHEQPACVPTEATCDPRAHEYPLPSPTQCRRQQRVAASRR